MSGGAYAGRVALLLFIFIVLIPGAVVAALYAMENSPGHRSEAIGWGYVAFFVGIPLWVLAFAIALVRTTQRRVRAVGLPIWVSLTIAVFLIADWQQIPSMGYWLRSLGYAALPPFLLAVPALMLALIFWPDRAPVGSIGSERQARANQIAMYALAVHAALAFAAFVTSIFLIWGSVTSLFWVLTYIRWPSHWSLLAMCGAFAWAIVEGRQRTAKE